MQEIRGSLISKNMEHKHIIDSEIKSALKTENYPTNVPIQCLPRKTSKQGK